MSKDDYEVGFGKPPKHSQFVKGESGNEGRRKKRPETHAEIIARVRDETMEVGGKRMSLFELSVRSTFNGTIKRGYPRDLKAMFELLDKYGAMPEGDRYADMQADANAAMEKIGSVIDRIFHVDPQDQAEIDRLQNEEIAMVTRCPNCGPALRQQWHTPERLALAERSMRTPLQECASNRKKPL